MIKRAVLIFLAAAPLLFADEPDRVFKKGDWELRVFYLHKGTRSEGQRGVLLHNGEIVEGSNVGDELQTDLGLLEYFGETPTYLWFPSGWNFKEPYAIPGSSDTNRLPDEAGNLKGNPSP